MGGVKGDDQSVGRFALGEIDAWMMIQLLDEVLPLSLSKAVDCEFASEQKLRLVCCFVGFHHDLAPLSLFPQSLSQHTRLNSN
jgi:hypothetical protein